MLNLECFCCAGGMAEGFRRAGVEFHLAFDFAPDHCDSYERNIGHRPIAMDVRDLVRMARAGWRVDVDLFVADPPCTPWSPAGKRKGLDDERDMVPDTVELIRLLRPRRYLIANVPGLDNSKNWPVVQRLIGGLADVGYCVRDYFRLDAVDYGVPQFRVRPFWFGHLEGPCLRAPAATHADPLELARAVATLPGTAAALKPWVTCKEALGHLSVEELGRPVRLRRKAPAATSVPGPGDGTLVINHRHQPAQADRPAPTMGAKGRSQGAQVLVYTEGESENNHGSSDMRRPAKTVLSGDGGGARRALRLEVDVTDREDIGDLDQPSRTITGARRGGNAYKAGEWPWDRTATTVCSDERLAPPGHHSEDGSYLPDERGVLISERAGAILQGFPDGWTFCGETKKVRWSQIGQAMPPRWPSRWRRRSSSRGARPRPSVATSSRSRRSLR